MDDQPGTPQPRNPATPQLIAAAIALLFLLIRVVLLVAREPFFDELYTLWMARQPFGAIVPHLLHDSGPPLYYLIARIPSVFALRWLSLLFAAVPLVLIVSRRSLGNARFIAAALLAVYPPAAFYATEARAYALCAMLVAIGVLLFDDDRPMPAALAFVLAAYSHYYGVLFFPLLLTKGRRGVPAFAAAAVLFAPGLFLALQQPIEATGWNVFEPLLAPLTNLSFAGRYVTFAPAPMALVAVALIALAIAVARSWRFAPAVLIPIAVAMAFSLAGRHVYFPMRFESVIAVPLVLWAATSLERWQPAVRRLLIAVLMFIGAAVLAIGTADLVGQPLSSCARAALFVAQRVPAAEVVAGDYCYLHAWATLGPRVVAFPPELGEHPGWYRPPSVEAARRAARSLPATGFVFIGNGFTPELAAVRQVRRVQLLWRDGPTVVLRIEPE